MIEQFREMCIRAGMLAHGRGIPRKFNPYQFVPASRQGDVKRAYWLKGWDEAESLADMTRYTITDKGRALLGEGK